jgi:hypothetical protein
LLELDPRKALAQQLSGVLQSHVAAYLHVPVKANGFAFQHGQTRRQAYRCNRGIGLGVEDL